MVSMFAPKCDIATFTGERTKEEQARQLASRGIDFHVNPKGDIIVLRSDIENKIRTSRPDRKQKGHNFAAIQ